MKEDDFSGVLTSQSSRFPGKRKTCLDNDTLHIIYHNWRRKGKTCSHVSFDREEDFLVMKRLDNNIGFFSPRAAGRIIKPGVCEINKKKRGEKKKKIGDKVKDTRFPRWKKYTDLGRVRANLRGRHNENPM